MPRRQQLKVYRTPIGFHDAYVAAPSQKAALEAWGSDADLFARGVAERVDDPELMREPLAHPGEVIRRSRGTASEQIAALPKKPPPPPRRRQQETAEPVLRKPARARSAAPAKSAKAEKPARPGPKPKPDAAALRAAEQKLEEADARHKLERAALIRRQADLDRERRRIEQQHDAERAKLEREVDKEQSAYDRAMPRGDEDETPASIKMRLRLGGLA